MQKSAKSQDDLEVISLGDLKPDEQNAKGHSFRSVGMVANFLQDVGAVCSIVIDEDGKILTGNATVP